MLFFAPKGLASGKRGERRSSARRDALGMRTVLRYYGSILVPNTLILSQYRNQFNS